jgi:hypothetical protein
VLLASTPVSESKVQKKQIAHNYYAHVSISQNHCEEKTDLRIKKTNVNYMRRNSENQTTEVVAATIRSLAQVCLQLYVITILPCAC